MNTNIHTHTHTHTHAYTHRHEYDRVLPPDALLRWILLLPVLPRHARQCAWTAHMPRSISAAHKRAFVRLASTSVVIEAWSVVRDASTCTRTFASVTKKQRKVLQCCSRVVTGVLQWSYDGVTCARTYASATKKQRNAAVVAISACWWWSLCVWSSRYLVYTQTHKHKHKTT
jgi:hypothetical protein